MLLVPLDIYVAPTGSDAANGLSPGTAVQTLAGAYAKIPTTNLGAAVRIHIATYPDMVWTPIPSFNAFNDTGQIILVGDGAGQGGEDGFTLVASGAAGGGTTNSSIAFASTADVHAGLTVQFTSGAAAGQRRTIRNNTTTALIPCSAFDPAPSPGDSLEIVRPAAVADISSSSALIAESTEANTTLINLGFTGGGTGTRAATTRGVHTLKMYGVTFEDGAGFGCAEGATYCGVGTSNINIETQDIGLETLAAAMASSPVAFGDVEDWEGWGISSPDSTLNALGLIWNRVVGFVLSRERIIFNYQPSCISLIGGGSLAGWAMNNGGLLEVIAQSIPALMRADTGSAIECSGGKVTIPGGDLSCIFENGPNDPPALLELYRGAEALLGIPGSTVTLSKTDGLAAVYVDASVLNIQPSTINCTINNCNGLQAINGAKIASVEATEFNVTGTGSEDENAMLADRSSQIAMHNINFSLVAAVALASQGSSILAGTVVGAGDESVGDAAFAIYATGHSQVSFASLQGTVSDTAIVAANASQVSCLANSDVDLLDGASIGILCNLSSSVYYGGDLQPLNPESCSAPGVLAGAGELVVQGNISMGDGVAVIAEQNANVTVVGDLASNTSCVRAKTNANVALSNCNLVTGGEDPVCAITQGASLAFAITAGPSSVTGAGNGIDASGGGTVTFETAADISFTVVGDELVVGPGVLESSSFALALANAGDTFSNAGAGSSMSLRTLG